MNCQQDYGLTLEEETRTQLAPHLCPTAGSSTVQTPIQLFPKCGQWTSNIRITQEGMLSGPYPMATEQDSLRGFGIWNLTNVERILNLSLTKNGLLVLVYGIGALWQLRNVPEKQKLKLCVRR